MAQTIPHAGPGNPSDPAPYLDCERLDCFRVAVEFQALATGLCLQRRLGALRDQLDRASVSIALNIAEGAGRRTRADKAHFFTIARGSATECAAVLELLSARGLLAPPAHRHARSLLVRIVQMLTRLIGATDVHVHEARARSRSGA
jgi:four helix bundle protein